MATHIAFIVLALAFAVVCLIAANLEIIGGSIFAQGFLYFCAAIMLIVALLAVYDAGCERRRDPGSRDA